MSDLFTAHKTLRAGVVRVEAQLVDFAFPAHSHDHLCVGLVRDGEHDCRYGLRRHVVTKGDLMLVNPGEVHDGKPSGGCGRRYSMLEIDHSAWRAMCVEMLGTEAFEFERAVVRHPEARRALAGWLASLSEGDVVAERDAAATLCGTFSRTAGREPTRREASTLATRISTRMRERTEETDSLGAFSAEFGISRFQLVRAFKQAFGLTPEDFRRQLRLERARTLLTEPQSHALSDIAASAGFSDQSHMTREFRRMLGLSPGAYRRALK
ncbi:MAG: AraC family transcriptional regulator [Archangium sp.]